jgi:hypothetical protein
LIAAGPNYKAVSEGIGHAAAQHREVPLAGPGFQIEPERQAHGMLLAIQRGRHPGALSVEVQRAPGPPEAILREGAADDLSVVLSGAAILGVAVEKIGAQQAIGKAGLGRHRAPQGE